MSVLEIKGTLAKLLATENLIVQHTATATTASFNTATRVLTLPLLQTDNQHVYDMFIGHEVGHALWTPVDWRDQIDESVPFDYVNVIEDVRIERMIQDKFPGLKRDFSRGYTELNNKDFFEIADKDISTLSFIDRVNLHFKLGSRAIIPFNEEEMVYVRAVEDADSFNKVCLVSKMIADYMNAKREQESLNQTISEVEGDAGDSENPGNPQQQAPQDVSGDDSETDNTEVGESQAVDGNKLDAGDDKSHTQRAMDKHLERMVEQGDSYRDMVTYVTAPNKAPSIFPISFLREDFDTRRLEVGCKLDATDDRFHEFMLSIRRDVSYMVQQFEMKKSADAYSRTQIHKTGVLDMEKLHQYKLTDDVFLRQSVTPDGKNHGLFMMVDWSGSMSDYIVETVKQLLVIVQFCRKAGIPYDVYTFTNGWDNTNSDMYELVEANDVSLHGVQCTHVLTSQCNRRVAEQDMCNLFHQAWKLSYSYSGANYSHQLAMGGTPLNNMLFGVPAMIHDFKVNNNVQKVSFVCLTDGESAPLKYYTKHNDKVYNEMVQWGKTFLRDGSRVYSLKTTLMTQSIVKYLTDKMPDVSITNIYLTGPKGSVQYAKENLQTSHYDITDFKKNGSDTITTTDGWPLICLVNPRTFKSGTEDIEVEAGAGKAKVRAALKKFLKGKSSSKLLLASLVDQFS